MFFSGKKNTSPPEPAKTPVSAPARSQQEENHNAIRHFLDGNNLVYEENPDNEVVILRAPFGGVDLLILFRYTKSSVSILVRTPFEATGCTTDEADLLCAYISSRVVGGSFSLGDNKKKHVFIKVAQRTVDAGTIGDKTMEYLFGTMLTLLNSEYMKALTNLCKGYKSLSEVLGELAE